MFVKCKVPYGNRLAGDVVELPDGAEVSELFFEVVDAPAAEPITPPIA